MLGGGDRDAEALLEAGDSVQCDLLLDLRPVIAVSDSAMVAMRSSSARTHRAVHTCSLLPVTIGRATA